MMPSSALLPEPEPHGSFSKPHHGPMAELSVGLALTPVLTPDACHPRWLSVALTGTKVSGGALAETHWHD